ncbi:hypothetical protein ES704_00487 [subsurface metagenome]|jgi:hypothetical protein
MIGVPIVDIKGCETAMSEIPETLGKIEVQGSEKM